MVIDSNRLSRHSTIQSGSRLSTPTVPPLAVSASCVGRRSGSTTSLFTATPNKSITSKNGKCTDAFHLSLVQEFSQFKQIINDLQVTVANNAANIQSYKQENQQLAAKNRELQILIRNLLSSGGSVHSSVFESESNINNNNINSINNNIVNSNPSHANSIINNYNSNNSNNNINSNYFSNNKNNNNIINSSNYTNNYNSLQHVSCNRNVLNSEAIINNSVSKSVDCVHAPNGDFINTYNDDARVSAPSSPLPRRVVPSTAAAAEDVIAVERRELYISGFMHVQNDDSIYSISFATFKVLLPTLNRHDICSARVVKSRAVGGEGVSRFQRIDPPLLLCD